MGEFDRAITDYNEAIRLDSRDPVALAYQSKGNLDAAVADFQSALRLNPPDSRKYREMLDAVESAKRQGKR